MVEVALLLVEDEPLIALSVEELLAEGGYAVIAAASGAKAMEILEAGEPVISGIVTDIRCPPGADGWELARRGRELNPNLAVVYFSGDSAHDHRARGVPDSVMVQKPFAASQIITAISMLLNAVPSPSSANDPDDA